MTTPPLQSVKIFQSEDAKDFSCSSWDQLHTEVSQWMKDEPFLLVNERTPWASLPSSGPITSSLSPRLAVIRLRDKNIHADPEDILSDLRGPRGDILSDLRGPRGDILSDLRGPRGDILSDPSSPSTPSTPFVAGQLPSTLVHFLNQPDSKVEYFLHNPSYEDRLQQDMRQFLTTFPVSSPESTPTLGKIVRKLNSLLTKETEHDVLYHQWVLDIMSMGSQLPPPILNQIKHLSHLVFDTILYSSN